MKKRRTPKKPAPSFADEHPHLLREAGQRSPEELERAVCEITRAAERAFDKIDGEERGEDKNP